MKEFITNVVPMKQCIEVKYPAKGRKTYALTPKNLEKIYKQAKEIGKKPSLIIMIPINDKEVFKVSATIYKEKRS